MVKFTIGSELEDAGTRREVAQFLTWRKEKKKGGALSLSRELR
jgi:hypothetical protein